jgi:riboflavin kinase/FMN adenylyltransferase
MLVFRGLPEVGGTPLALTIGNFDGVHRGHQAMLARLLEAAADLRLPPAVLTFAPPPREYFLRDNAPPRLSTPRDKIEQLTRVGVERVYFARFDERLARLAADAFVEQVLLRSLAVKWLLVGDDFRFGRGRLGEVKLLRDWSARRGFSVETLGTVTVEGERASSTAVRSALLEGDMTHAARLLGRPYAISGRVAHGRKLGRSLGFPTANLPLRRAPPLSGVYAVAIDGIPGGKRQGVASLGVRPTVDALPRPVLEVFVFDYQGELYGRRLKIEFLRKLREEHKFPNLEALTARIRQDADEARRFFAAES